VCDRSHSFVSRPTVPAAPATGPQPWPNLALSILFLSSFYCRLAGPVWISIGPTTSSGYWPQPAFATATPQALLSVSALAGPRPPWWPPHLETPRPENASKRAPRFQTTRPYTTANSAPTPTLRRSATQGRIRRWVLVPPLLLLPPSWAEVSSHPSPGLVPCSLGRVVCSGAFPEPDLTSGAIQTRRRLPLPLFLNTFYPRCPARSGWGSGD